MPTYRVSSGSYVIQQIGYGGTGGAYDTTGAITNCGYLSPPPLKPPPLRWYINSEYLPNFNTNEVILYLLDEQLWTDIKSQSIVQLDPEDIASFVDSASTVYTTISISDDALIFSESDISGVFTHPRFLLHPNGNIYVFSKDSQNRLICYVSYDKGRTFQLNSTSSITVLEIYHVSYPSMLREFYIIYGVTVGYDTSLRLAIYNPHNNTWENIPIEIGVLGSAANEPIYSIFTFDNKFHCFFGGTTRLHRVYTKETSWGTTNTVATNVSDYRIVITIDKDDVIHCFFKQSNTIAYRSFANNTWSTVRTISTHTTTDISVIKALILPNDSFFIFILKKIGALWKLYYIKDWTSELEVPYFDGVSSNINSVTIHITYYNEIYIFSSFNWSWYIYYKDEWVGSYWYIRSFNFPAFYPFVDQTYPYKWLPLRAISGYLENPALFCSSRELPSKPIFIFMSEFSNFISKVEYLTTVVQATTSVDSPMSIENLATIVKSTTQAVDVLSVSGSTELRKFVSLNIVAGSNWCRTSDGVIHFVAKIENTGAHFRSFDNGQTWFITPLSNLPSYIQIFSPKGTGALYQYILFSDKYDRLHLYRRPSSFPKSGWYFLFENNKWSFGDVDYPDGFSDTSESKVPVCSENPIILAPSKIYRFSTIHGWFYNKESPYTSTGLPHYATKNYVYRINETTFTYRRKQFNATSWESEVTIDSPPSSYIFVNEGDDKWSIVYHYNSTKKIRYKYFNGETLGNPLEFDNANALANVCINLLGEVFIIYRKIVSYGDERLMYRKISNRTTVGDEIQIGEPSFLTNRSIYCYPSFKTDFVYDNRINYNTPYSGFMFLFTLFTISGSMESDADKSLFLYQSPDLTWHNYDFLTTVADSTSSISSVYVGIETLVSILTSVTTIQDIAQRLDSLQTIILSDVTVNDMKVLFETVQSTLTSLVSIAENYGVIEDVVSTGVSISLITEYQSHIENILTTINSVSSTQELAQFIDDTSSLLTSITTTADYHIYNEQLSSLLQVTSDIIDIHVWHEFVETVAQATTSLTDTFVYTENLLTSITAISQEVDIQQILEPIITTINSISTIVDKQDYLELLTITIPSLSTTAEVQMFVDDVETLIASETSMLSYQLYKELLQTNSNALTSGLDIQHYTHTLVSLATTASSLQELYHMVEVITTQIQSQSTTISDMTWLEVIPAITIKSTSIISDIQSYIELVNTISNSISSLVDRQKYYEAFETLITSGSTIEGANTTITNLVTFIASHSDVIDSLYFGEILESILNSVSTTSTAQAFVDIVTSLVTSTSNATDIKALFETLNTTILSMDTLEDRQLCIENVAIIALSTSVITDVMVYLERLLTAIASKTSVVDVLIDAFVGRYVKMTYVKDRLFIFEVPNRQTVFEVPFRQFEYEVKDR